MLVLSDVGMAGLRPGRRLGVALVAAAVSVLAVAGIRAAQAAAAEAPYGEVGRFGGFDSSPGGTTPGEFVTPVGFAVEPENPSTHEKNAVYVLDRTVSNVTNGELDYRLQKLSSAGVVLGSTTVTESYADKEKFSDAHPLAMLAVDPKRGRIYSLVESQVESGPGKYMPVADKLVAWSTEPNGNKELVRASAAEFSEEDSITKASVVASPAVLMPASISEMLYAPGGLAVDPSSGDVVIEAQKGVTGEVGGPTVLQRVTTVGATKGTLGAATKLGASATDQSGGLFAATDGSGGFGSHLWTKPEARSRLVTVPGEFGLVTEPGTSSSESLVAEGVFDETQNQDDALSLDLAHRPGLGTSAAKGVAGGRLENFTAAGQFIQLTDSRHLYAALYAPHFTGPKQDSQGEVEPWRALTGGKETGESLWMVGGGSDEAWANMGVRLFESDGTIVDTVGGGQPTAAPNSGPTMLAGSCDIDYEAASLAAGAEGTVFVLTQPDTRETPAGGDEVVEFAPGGHYACPSVKGNIEVNGVEARPENGQAPTVDVSPNVLVTFSALSLDHQLTWNPPVKLEAKPFEWKPEPVEWQPFEFEWNFGDETSETHRMEANSAPAYAWPTPQAKHIYKTAGTYDASVRVYSDFGTNVFPVTVKVLASEPPRAAFVGPASALMGESVTFDAGGSAAAAGAQIELYEWQFGDGSRVERTTEPTIKHTFASAKTYEVKLTVHDREGSEPEASVVHSVVVAAPNVKPPAEEKTPGGTTSTNPAGSTGGGSGRAISPPSIGPPLSAQGTPPVSKPLTRAQKMARALKACHKDKPKKKRTSCEKAARKKYAPPKTHRKSKK